MLLKKTMIKAAIFAIGSVLLGSFGQVFMKVGMSNIDISILINHLQNLSIPSLNNLYPVFWVLTGISFYVLAMGSWLLVLARLDLSVAYPILSLSYAVVYLIAVFWDRLGETASLGKTIGIIFIITGVCLTSLNKKSKKTV